MVKCRFSNFDCTYEETPEDIEICKACASMKSADVEKEMITLQRMQTLATLAASLPYEEKDLQEKLNDRIKEILRDWLEKEESN